MPPFCCSSFRPYFCPVLLIPNRTFLVRFGGKSGEFGLAMGILARLRLAKIRTMARPNSPDMPPKRTKKVRLGISRTRQKYGRKDEFTVLFKVFTVPKFSRKSGEIWELRLHCFCTRRQTTRNWLARTSLVLAGKFLLLS